MSKVEFTVSMVRALKGAPLSCLIAIALSTMPASLEWLVGVTAYTANAIRPALKYLAEVGYIIQPGGTNKSGWIMNNGQYPLEVLEDLRKNCVNDPTATTARSEGIKELHSSSSRSPKHLLKNCVNVGVYDYLKGQGIGEPTLSQLCDLEWCNLEYVKAIVESGIREGKEIGLIIWRMKQHDAVSTIVESIPERYKYVSGELSKYVNH